MSELEEALGIETLMVIRDGDKEYKVAQWKMKHLNAVQDHSLEKIRSESIATLKAAKKADLLPPEEMRQALTDVMEKQGNWAAATMTPHGVTYFAYLLIKENHDELTFEMVEGMLGLDHLQQITDVLVDALGIEPEDEGPLGSTAASQ